MVTQHNSFVQHRARNQVLMLVGSGPRIESELCATDNASSTLHTAYHCVPPVLLYNQLLAEHSHMCANSTMSPQSQSQLSMHYRQRILHTPHSLPLRSASSIVLSAVGRKQSHNYVLTQKCSHDQKVSCPAHNEQCILYSSDLSIVYSQLLLKIDFV